MRWTALRWTALRWNWAGLLAMALAAAPAAAEAQAPDGAAQHAAAAPLGLSWGVLAEPAAEGTTAPGRLAEHVEFLRAHGWHAVSARDLAAGPVPARAVLLSFDDPASALRYAVPLLELYGMPAVVTVGAAQAEDPALQPALAALARTPGVELVPRVDPDPAASTSGTLRCGGESVPAATREERALSRLRGTLASQVARLRTLGAFPAAAAWAPGTWTGAGEAVAASLDLTLHLPTFGGMPPQLSGRRVARYAVPPWVGVWALVQASAHWDPEHHPVRFLEVGADWLCEAGGPEARVGRLLAAMQRLGLNGVRIRPGDASGVWFPTSAAPVRGDVVGPLTDRLHAAGVRWVMVDVPSTGDRGRDVTLATDLAREAVLDVALLPEGAVEGDRLGEALSYVRPAVRLGWRSERGQGAREFRLAPFAAGQSGARGLTVQEASPSAAGAEAADRARGGWEWIGLPVEVAEAGLRGSLRALAAFALPGAEEGQSP
jgi:hypothetical protein